MLTILSGKKTYVLAALFTAYAALGYALGMIDANEAIRITMESGLGATLRAGIAKV